MMSQEMNETLRDVAEYNNLIDADLRHLMLQ
jgi:hypothetical protein